MVAAETMGERENGCILAGVRGCVIEPEHSTVRHGTGRALRLARVGAGIAVVVLFGGASANAGELTDASPAVAAFVKSASTAWSTEQISARELGTGQPAPVAFDSSGDAFAVFTEPVLSIKESISLSYLVQATVRPADGHWQTPGTLSHLGLDPEVAVDGQGRAIAVWQASSSVEEAERPAGEGWLPPEAALTPSGEEPQVATNARGDAVIASTRQAPHRSGGIEVATRAADGPFLPAQMISGEENAFEPRVAMNAAGDVLVAWRVDSARGCPVRAAFHRAGGGWSRPRTVSDVHAFCESGNHRVAIDERGDAIVLWFAQRGRPLFVEEAERGADGRWSARRRLAKARTLERPEVAMDARGEAIVAWWQEGHELARVRPAGRRWLAARMVTRSAGSPASLAVDRRGDALLAWAGRRRIVEAAAKQSTRGGWETSVVAAGPGTDLAEPTSSIDPSGGGVVAWYGREGLNIATRASIFG
jgi:hypothetical protein